MNILGYISASILTGMALVWASQEIESTFIVDFLRVNLLLILPALMAINVTTSGVVMTKLRELSDKYVVDFSDAIEEMKISFREQTALMVIAALLLIAEGAHGIKWLPDNFPFKHDLRFILDSLICASFVYALFILHDTAQSIFKIISFENKKK